MSLSDFFSRTAQWTSKQCGRPLTFGLAAAVIVAWGACGPLFHYSDTWQLVINTSTTIVTFLMVFLIQSTQNRDTEAIQVKLDELIRAVGHARNELLDLEELEENDLDDLKKTFIDMAKKARADRLQPKPPRSDT